MKTENILIKGVSIKDIFLRFSLDPRNVPNDNEDAETLKSYLIYFINAPVFDSENTNELRSKDLKNMSLDEALNECLEYGLDPF